MLDSKGINRPVQNVMKRVFQAVLVSDITVSDIGMCQISCDPKVGRYCLGEIKKPPGPPGVCAADVRQNPLLIGQTKLHASEMAYDFLPVLFNFDKWLFNFDK
jgi:hypothetical protein